MNINEKISIYFKDKIYEKTSDLCQIMFKFGSDKSILTKNHHNYSSFYNFLFNDLKNYSLNIFELGIGSVDSEISSHMQSSLPGEKKYIPGASLRGWKEYFKNSNIFGADIDEKTLFEEERISTIKIDQLNYDSIYNGFINMNKKFNIIIDDGLHLFDANKLFLETAFQFLVPGGIFIVEDILSFFEPSFKNLICKEFCENLGIKYAALIKIPLSSNEVDNTLLVLEKKLV